MHRAIATGLMVVAVTVAVPARAVVPKPVNPVPVARVAEPHPEIKSAIAALERAKNHLQKAAHDFGGHRVEALAAVDKALEQLREALKYDK